MMSALDCSSRPRGRKAGVARLAVLVLAGTAIGATAAIDPFDPKFDLSEGRSQLEAGRFEEAKALAEEAHGVGWRSSGWQRLRIEALLATGEYEAAGEAAVELANDFSRELPTMLFVRDVLVTTGRAEDAERVIEFVNRFASALGEGVEDFEPDELVALGRAALELGAEPKQVLEQFFDVARRREPSLREAHFAAADLALEKHDYQLAADILAVAEEKAGESADLRIRQAQAFAPSDETRTVALLERALELNPRHAPTLAFLAEERIDADDPEGARSRIDAILEVNPNDSHALALGAALTFLENDLEAHEAFRRRALAFHKDNPEVDHVIGLRVSRKRRFDEGMAFQKRALEFDPGHLSAKLALALDLLRLGDEEAAWKLAEEVHEADGYDVLAFNLVTLRDHLAKFTTLEAPGFVLRMVPGEAPIYGRRVLDLLAEARDVLGSKYGLALDRPVLVEFFPQQQDFAVRTFGVPGGAGILGACFGSVVTMNSPGNAGAGESNWESTLWHEFCHVVTLTVTRNRMPRWLSEGISVYEEVERDPTWGQSMTPEYRRLILEEDGLIPLGELGGVFLNPESGEHLMLAYYLSSLAVRHLVDTHGMEAFRRVLGDLGDGLRLEEAMSRHLAPWDELEEAYEASVREEAERLAPDLDWEEPEPAILAAGDPEAIAEDWLAERPNSFWALRACARQRLEAGDPEAAIPLAEKLLAAFPGFTGADNGYVLLAEAFRALERPADERRMLEELASRTSDAPAVYRRLMDLHLEEERWEAAGAWAERQLAVNPMTPAPHRGAARAAQATGRHQDAVDAFARLLDLGPLNPAAVHFGMAESLVALERPDEARSHVIDALEQAPRFRDGHRLLLALSTSADADADASGPPPGASASPAADDAASFPSPDGPPTGAATN